MKKHINYQGLPFWKYLPFYIFASIPITFLRFISKIFYLITFYVIGYRRKVVKNNLIQAFPEKTKDEIKTIEKLFYKMFFNNLVESIKSICGKNNWFKVTYIESHDSKEFFEKQENKFLLTAHITNFEIISAYLPTQTSLKVKPIYKEQQNLYFDQLIWYSRTRFGVQMIEMDLLLKNILKSSEKSIYVMFGDQSTGMHPGVFWKSFMNKQTPFYMGTEKISKKFNLPVYYGYYYPGNKLGEYFCEIQKLLPENITSQYVEALEKNIRDFPHIYLWTHKRWKHNINEYKTRFKETIEG